MLLVDLIIFGVVLTVGNAIVMFGGIKYLMSERAMMKATQNTIKIIEKMNNELSTEF